MKKILLLLIALISINFVHSQSMGIGTTNFVPNSKSILEIQATGKGLLIPRMELANRPNGLSSTDEGMLIYQTDGTHGFYYYDGANWKLLFTDAWSLNGNTGTNPINNFIGTRDSIDLVFRTNLNERMRITANGNIGIGTVTPTQKLDVDGNIKFTKALMPNNDPGTNGKVLKSNGANAAPTWISAVTPDNVYSVESTDSIVLSTSWQIITGESITISELLVGDKLLIFYEGNAVMKTDNYANVDVAVFANNTMIKIGGYVRFSLDNSYATGIATNENNNISWQNYSSIARYTVTANGSYTFDVRATMSGSGTVNVGGSSTSASEGVLVIYLLRN